ncbi:MAG: hypothetical protein WAV22_01400 [Porticoccaceae bacterium]
MAVLSALRTAQVIVNANRSGMTRTMNAARWRLRELVKELSAACAPGVPRP